MKNLILSIFFLFTILPIQASAITTMAEDTIILSESVIDDLYSAGRKVVTNSLIDGDLIIAGQSLDIFSPVSDDLIAAGQFLDIEGGVGDDIRAVGQRITIGGSVGDSVIVFGQDIMIKNAAIIKGDFWAFGETIIINGEVKGDIRIEANQVFINAPINGDAKIRAATKIEIGENGKIAGNLKLHAQENIEATKVGGEISFTFFEQMRGMKDLDENIIRGFVGFVLGFALLKFLALLVIAAFLIWAIKNYILGFVKTAKKDWLPNMGIGFAVLILTPVLGLMLLLTIIGIPLAGLLFLGYAALIIVAKLAIGFLIGNLIIPINAKTSFAKMLGSFALGSFVYMLLTLIPFVGWIGQFVVCLIALGSISRMEWDFFKILRKAKKI